MRLGSTIGISDTPDLGNFHGGLAFGHFESMEFTQETGLARTWLRCDKGCVPRARPCHLSVRNGVPPGSRTPHSIGMPSRRRQSQPLSLADMADLTLTALQPHLQIRRAVDH